jgi:hypothetical protein
MAAQAACTISSGEPVHGSVLVIGQQDLAGSGQAQARRDDIDGRGDVGREDQLPDLAAEERGQAFAGLPEQRRSLAQEEVHGFLGQAAPQGGDVLEDHARQGTKRAGVEIGHGGIEQDLGSGLRPEWVRHGRIVFFR